MQPSPIAEAVSPCDPNDFTFIDSVFLKIREGHKVPAKTHYKTEAAFKDLLSAKINWVFKPAIQLFCYDIIKPADHNAAFRHHRKL
jgi:hypothetical protein